MVIRLELARTARHILIKVQFVGVSGQVCSTSYEVLGGDETLCFLTRADAEAALRTSIELAA